MIIHVSYAYHILRDLMDGDSLVWYHCVHKQSIKICPAFEFFLILKMPAEQLN